MTREREKELRDKVFQMMGIAKVFEDHVQKVGGLGPFQYFAGILNEYINMCGTALAKGEDFAATGVTVQGHNATYISEKLNQIFGIQITKGDNAKAFEGLFG